MSSTTNKLDLFIQQFPLALQQDNFSVIQFLDNQSNFPLYVLITGAKDKEKLFQLFNAKLEHTCTSDFSAQHQILVSLVKKILAAFNRTTQLKMREYVVGKSYNSLLACFDSFPVEITIKPKIQEANIINESAYKFADKAHSVYPFCLFSFPRVAAAHDLSVCLSAAPLLHLDLEKSERTAMDCFNSFVLGVCAKFQYCSGWKPWLACTKDGDCGRNHDLVEIDIVKGTIYFNGAKQKNSINLHRIKFLPLDQGIERVFIKNYCTVCNMEVKENGKYSLQHIKGKQHMQHCQEYARKLSYKLSNNFAFTQLPNGVEYNHKLQFVCIFSLIPGFVATKCKCQSQLIHFNPKCFFRHRNVIEKLRALIKPICGYYQYRACNIRPCKLQHKYIRIDSASGEVYLDNSKVNDFHVKLSELTDYTFKRQAVLFDEEEGKIAAPKKPNYCENFKQNQSNHVDEEASAKDVAPQPVDEEDEMDESEHEEEEEAVEEGEEAAGTNCAEEEKKFASIQPAAIPRAAEKKEVENINCTPAAKTQRRKRKAKKERKTQSNSNEATVDNDWEKEAEDWSGYEEDESSEALLVSLLDEKLLRLLDGAMDDEKVVYIVYRDDMEKQIMPIEWLNYPHNFLAIAFPRTQIRHRAARGIEITLQTDLISSVSYVRRSVGSSWECRSDLINGPSTEGFIAYRKEKVEAKVMASRNVQKSI
jgi:hypothetical protein